MSILLYLNFLFYPDFCRSFVLNILTFWCQTPLLSIPWWWVSTYFYESWDSSVSMLKLYFEFRDFFECLDEELTLTLMLFFPPPVLSKTLLWLPDFFDCTLYFFWMSLSKLWFLLRSMLIGRSVSWFDYEFSPRCVTMFVSSSPECFRMYILLSSTDPFYNLPYLCLDFLRLTTVIPFCAVVISLVDLGLSPTFFSSSCTTISSSILLYYAISIF